MKPLLIGESNPYGSNPEYALYPLPERAAGGRLVKILGLSAREYLRWFDRRNLCRGPWSLTVARVEADQILRIGGYERIVLLGAKVSKAFGVDYLPFTSAWKQRSQLLILPHPSGLNRKWNEPGSEERARALLREFRALPDPNGVPPLDSPTDPADPTDPTDPTERGAECSNCGALVDPDAQYCPCCGVGRDYMDCSVAGEATH